MKEAATVVLLREGPQGHEVFLMQRHRRTGFFGGAYVFPGGKLDDADSSEVALGLLPKDHPWPSFRDRQSGAAVPARHTQSLYLSGLRELFEEADVLLGAGGDSAELKAGARRALDRGSEAFYALLAEAGFVFDTGPMRYWSHWITPELEGKRFDTRFFLCEMPAEQVAQSADRESVHVTWLGIEDALTKSQKREIVLPPPTLRTLEEIHGHGMENSPHGDIPQPILPRIAQNEDGAAIVLPWHQSYDDLPGEGYQPQEGYPQALVRMPGRIVMDGKYWRSDV